MHWYERADIIDRLMVFGRALQGFDPYEVVIEPNPYRCRSAYCNFNQRRIAVNPTYFKFPPERQLLLTKALLIHEAGHRRFSQPGILPNLALQVANVLEDERVDTRMCADFAAVGWFLRHLCREFLARSEPVGRDSDAPDVIISYILRLRWANRLGQPIEDSLSVANQALWERVKPLVYESWQAETAQTVDRNAAEIVGILGLGDSANDDSPADKLICEEA